MKTRFHRMPVARLFGAVLLAALLAGCGWHLRGSYNLPEELVPIAVDGDGVASELRESLRVSKALARATDEAPSSRVEILEENNTRRVISVDAQGKVDEYELRYEVRWQLTARGSDDNARRILIAPLTFSANRSYDFESGEVLSKSEQERILIETMREDIAQRILFRLQGWQVGQGDTETDSGEGETSSNG